MHKSLSKPQLVVQNGKPAAVILDIRSYEKLLTLAEDAEDLREIRRLKRRCERLVSLEDYLAKRH